MRASRELTLPLHGLRREKKGQNGVPALIVLFPNSSKRGKAGDNVLVVIDILLVLVQGMFKLPTVIGSCLQPVLQLVYLLLEVFQLLQTSFLFPPCIPLAPVEKGMGESVCLSVARRRYAVSHCNAFLSSLFQGLLFLSFFSNLSLQPSQHVL